MNLLHSKGMIIMINQKKLVETINQSVYYNKEALKNIYRGKVFAVALTENNIQKFFKTKRGAEGYINRQQRVSYYDDYSQSMVTCGAGLEVVEIPDTELKDLYNDPYVWYHELYNEWRRGRNPLNTLNETKRLQVNENVLQFVESFVNELITESGFRHIDEYEDKETVLETASETPQQDESTITAIEEDHQQKTEKVENNITITYKLNSEKNGVEIYFTDKPDEEIRNLMKSNGFRWAKYNKCWYAKQSEGTITFAKQLAGEQIDNNSDITESRVTYEDIDIDDIETYTVSEDLQKREYDSSWIFRNSETDRTKELQDVLQNYQNQVIELINSTDNQYIIYQLKKSIQYFKKHYSNNFIKRLEHNANNPSWFVTGASGRNRRRDEKMNNRYDNLTRESIELMNGIESRIKKYRNKIEKERREVIQKQIQYEIDNNTIELDFRTVTKELTYMGIKEKKRVYICGNYFICKLWACFRIFNVQTMQEVHSMKTTESLQAAKNYVLYLVKKDQEQSKIAI